MRQQRKFKMDGKFQKEFMLEELQLRLNQNRAKSMLGFRLIQAVH
jgi:hypothetical protein